jgi:2-polyprenyl-3-methyl-5-hydroxy-6-metoxy-1,4-benzoquinol methylase
MSFAPVWAHRLGYFLTPQLDLYRNIAAKFPEATRIMDYGCGTGFGLLQMAGTTNLDGMAAFRIPLGIDHDVHAIDVADRLLGKVATFRAEDWSGIKLDPGYEDQFDLVTCIEVIEHIVTPVRLLKNLAASVSPGGYLVVSTLNHNSQYRKNNDHRSKFHVDSFTALIQEACELPFITDFKLTDPVDDMSQVTPIVSVWRKPSVA